MMFGLKDHIINMIREVFVQYPEVEKVLIYGSRARGDYKEGSDIDLSMIGDISYRTEASIWGKIDDLPMLYMCDLSRLAHIKNENLVEHINRVGKVFYQKEI